ncbi:hypothetical protein ACE6H2_016267 [Prunus campanulata]
MRVAPPTDLDLLRGNSVELCMSGAKPEETLAKAHDDTDVQITAGRWSWKSKSAKECVTTHLLNQLALKKMALKRTTYTMPSSQVPSPDE